jgi:hypothetical protein
MSPGESSEKQDRRFDFDWLRVIEAWDFSQLS